MINPTTKSEISQMTPDSILTGSLPLQVKNSIHSKRSKAAAGISERSSKKSGQSQNEFNFLLQYMKHLSHIVHYLENKDQRQQSNEGIVGETALAGLVHDLKNPVAIINSCAQFCLENETLTPTTKENLKMIQESGKKATKMLRQLMDFSKCNLSFKTFDLNQIIHKAWKSAIMGTNYGGKLEAKLSEDLPEIIGDPEKLERVFLNIFLNAIQAGAENHSEMIVTVQTFHLQLQKSVEINVIDNGPGIPKKFRKSIFTPFFTTKREGTGLGLHVCQGIVNQHKGEIFIRKGPRGGTKVTIRLPLIREEVV